MSTLLRNKESEPCRQCQVLRRSFISVAMSAVVPILVFTALLLCMDLSEKGPAHENVRRALVESVAGLLHIQLFLATAVLIASVMRKRRLLKYRTWYFIIHVVIMTLSFLLSLALTFVNESYTPFCVTALVATLYLYIVSRLSTVLRFKMAC